MTLKELIQTERIAATEARQTLIRTVEDLFKVWFDRLNDLELRSEKEALTGGEVSFTAKE